MLVLVPTSGCIASFRSGDRVEDKRALAAMPAQKPSIALVIAGTVENLGEAERSMRRWELEQLIEEIVTTYQRSGLFSAVKPGLDGADLRAEIRFSNRAEHHSGLWWRLLTVFSAGLIPAREPTEHYAMTTTFRTRTAVEISTIHRENTVTTWFGWVFLPLHPFRSPPSVESRSQEATGLGDSLRRERCA